MAAERRAILITRPQPDADEMARMVEARGFEPVVAPLLAVRPRKLSAPGRFDAVIVTSRNAIPALPRDLHQATLLTVGSATAARAREAGFARVLDADGDATALAELARTVLPRGAKLLFVHGMRQGDGLAACLVAQRFRVTRRRAYSVRPVRALAEPARDALRGERLRTVTFLSAETALAFVRLLPERLRPHLERVDAAAIGAAAADALAPLPWRRVRVSLRPTLDEVLALL